MLPAKAKHIFRIATPHTTRRSIYWLTGMSPPELTLEGCGEPIPLLAARTAYDKDIDNFQKEKPQSPALPTPMGELSHRSSKAPTFIPDIADTKILASSAEKKPTDVVIHPCVTKRSPTKMIVPSPSSYPSAIGNIPLIRRPTTPPLFLDKPSSATTVPSPKDLESEEPRSWTSEITQEIEKHDKNKAVEDMLQSLIARFPGVAEMKGVYEYLEAVQKKRR